MMQCPNCQGRVFLLGKTTYSTVLLLCKDDGDYEEKKENVENCEWHTLQCCHCQQFVDQDDAILRFECATDGYAVAIPMIPERS